MYPGLPRGERRRGVSPVIGVLVLVAITVMLAAVLGTFASSMGPATHGPASVTVQWTNHSGVVTLRHGGGEALDASAYTVVVEERDGTIRKRSLAAWPGNDRLTAGDSVAIGFNTVGTSWMIGIPVRDVEEVRLVWHAPDGDRTRVVARWPA